MMKRGLSLPHLYATSTDQFFIIHAGHLMNCCKMVVWWLTMSLKLAEMCCIAIKHQVFFCFIQLTVITEVQDYLKKKNAKT